MCQNSQNVRKIRNPGVLLLMSDEVKLIQTKYPVPKFSLYFRMRLICTMLLLCSLSIVLCGCPYYSPYPLENEPAETVNDSWLGTWQWKSKETHETTFITLTRANDKEYSIAISGSVKAFTSISLKDSIKAYGYTSKVDNMVFLNVFYNSRWYIVQVVEKNNSLSFLPLSEHFTSRIVTNSNMLKNAVSYHFKHRIIASYDDIKLDEMQR